MNEKVREALNYFYQVGCERYLYLFAQTEGSKTYEQLKRMSMQDTKEHNFGELINTGKGFDYSVNLPVNIIDEPIEIENYNKILEKIAKESKIKGWSFDIIDNCLFIGVYYRNFMSIAFREWLKSCNFNLDYPIVDLRHGFNTPLSYPIFFRGISKDIIIDIAFAKCEVLLYFNFDNYIELLKGQGFDVRWVRIKEQNNKGLFQTKDHRVLQIEKNGKKIYFGDGLLVKIFYDGITPKSTIQFIESMFINFNR